jgi:hypothetical protein
VKTLVTHGGKIGDALWALASVKYLSMSDGPIAFATSPYCRGLKPLLERQGWIDAVTVLEDWQIEFSAPIKPVIPRMPETGRFANYDRVLHLSAREWPTPTLGEYYPRLLKQEYGIDVYPDFSRPWLNVGSLDKREELVLSFSPEYVESKVGTILALKQAIPLPIRLCVAPGSRISKEFGLERVVEVEICDLTRLAERLHTARVAVVCNSMAHPLGVGVGANLVVYEPQPMRHQALFKCPPGGKVLYSDSVDVYKLIPLVERALQG